MQQPDQFKHGGGWEVMVSKVSSTGQKEVKHDLPKNIFKKKIKSLERNQSERKKLFIKCN